ncbi:aminoacyl-tRNA hydrolase [Candidatus Gottesmanbacteria bacterium]|nr:aminoacyl-tRNA hydrolase [Candidatus Gottesmanbacteria bacterium]
MKLIVGLGNPGDKYAQTRHNIGFMVVDRLAHEIGAAALLWKEEEKHKALIAKVGDVILIKPLTFMNNVGISIRSLADYYNISPEDVWVIHDDIDLPIGKVRIRAGGASAGHHGIDSIIAHLKSDKFVRFRLGIGRGMKSTGRTMDKNLHHRRVIEFVLSRFHQNEGGDLKHLVQHGTQAVRVSLEKGTDKAMNRFN